MQFALAIRLGTRNENRHSDAVLPAKASGSGTLRTSTTGRQVRTWLALRTSLYLALVVLSLPVPCLGAGSPPRIISISPSSGSTAGGNPVTLFCSGVQSGAIVIFSSSTISVFSSSPIVFLNAPSFKFPQKRETSVNVVIINPDGQSSSKVFSAAHYTYVVPAPTILNSNGTKLGSKMSISGQNFVGKVTVAFKTAFSSIDVTATVNSSASIAVTIPSSAKTGFVPITVTALGGSRTFNATLTK
jgi:hypothetical protein